MAEVKAGLPQSALKPITDSGAGEADEKYRNALDYITQALLAREGNNQQQQLLAISQGLLTPGPTGSFGESVGHAAGNVLKTQKEQEATGLENAKMRLQLAQAEREQAQKNQGLKILEQLDAGGSGQGGAQITKGDDSGFGVMIGGNEVTPKLIRNMLVRNPEIGKALQVQYELTLKGIQTQQGGAYNILTGKYTPFGGKALVSRNIPGRGVVDMSEQDAMDLDEARRNNDFGKFNEIVKRNTMPMTEKSDQGEGKESPSGSEKPVTPMTKASIEAENAAAKEAATKTAAAEVDRTQQTIEAGRGASNRITHYKTMEGFAKQPGVAALMGYFERPDFLAAAGKFIEEGRFGVPQMREILTNLGAPQEVINNLNVLSSLAAQTSIDFSKSYGKGQGAVSDFERRLYASLGPTIKDPLEAFMMKSKLLTAKAEYERDLASALRRSKKSFDDFQDLPEYQKIVDNYQRKAYEVAGIKQPAAAPTSGPITAADVKTRLGIKQ